jgi:hypothetical protein
LRTPIGRLTLGQPLRRIRAEKRSPRAERLM